MNAEIRLSLAIVTCCAFNIYHVFEFVRGAIQRRFRAMNAELWYFPALNTSFTFNVYHVFEFVRGAIQRRF
jgi:hypothetical protein